MSLIAFLVRSSWQMVAIALLTGCLSGGSSAGLIALINRVVSQGVTNVSVMAATFVGLAAIALISSIICQMMLIRLSQQAIFQLCLSLSRQVLNSELAHLESLGAARILATLTEDVQTVADAVRLVPFVFVDLAMVIGSIVYVTWLSWQVAAFLLVVMVVTLTGYQWVMQQAKRKLTLARAEQDHLFKYFRAITDGIKELKLNYLRRQAFLREDLQTAATTYRRYNVEGLDLFAVISSIGSFILFFMIGLVLFALPNLLTLDLPTLSSYTLVFVFMLSPMENLTRRLPYIAGAEVALNKIESLNLSLTDRSEIVTIPATVQQNWQSLRLQGVTHAYGSHTEDQFILGSIDLSFHPGEIVFIVGGNGSGKSTLAKLITGLYIPESGSIDLDGRIITVENREWYRQHFAAIFADFYLFDRLLGMKGINLDQQAQSYLKQLHLDRKVTIENGILSTTALSQGQRKRLALLTAYLEDRPIYLFDEWAADQDPSFKELFYTKFLPELRDRGKTILVISHDDHYFHVGDRIIKLDYGKVEYDKQRNQ